MRHIRTNAFNPVSPEQADFLQDIIISIDDELIVAIKSFSAHQGAWEDYRDCIVTPGFIDLHVHLSQYRIRGIYYPALLPWLEHTVFPEEAKSRNPDFARHISEDFYRALWRNGTTYSVIYTAPNREAAEMAFIMAQEMGVQARIGMTLMDMNSPDGMQQSTDYALRNSIELNELYQNQMLGYIFTPRFAPTCSEILMREIGTYAKRNKSFIQTHLSENPDEIRWVKELFGKSSYTQVYQDFGLLSPRTILGHAIHLSDAELTLLKHSASAIAHCPDSNFYLKSGEYPLSRIAQQGIAFGLGSDVGAGTTLNMLYHAKQMNYRQSKHPVLPAEMLYRITRANAMILGLDHRIGGLKEGLQADLNIFQVPSGFDIEEHSLSQLCFMSEDFQLKEVLVKGKNKLPAY
ncbi:MAG: amidohydrolase family protein [Candidatus Cloacimonetes bacterium]|nr:amidohydrolase family protein [Candidatus Cloacimonadota bacterium]